MLDLELVTAPEVALLTAEEMRAQCRVDVADHDDELAGYLAAATAHLDGHAGILGRALAEQEWVLYLDRFPASSIRLPLPPLQSVTSITYVDEGGDTQTLATNVYRVLAGERAEIVRDYNQVWPSVRCQARSVAITFVCGWTPTDGVWPVKVEPIRQALKLMVGDLFENRESSIQGSISAEIKIPLAVDRLLAPLRVPRL